MRHNVSNESDSPLDNCDNMSHLVVGEFFGFVSVFVFPITPSFSILGRCEFKK
jgi:hypothetical protein